jgi:predicted site-specific integrase-resolvase
MVRYMTVKEVAAHFRRSKKTIYRWIDEGRVFRDVVKVKDGILIPENEVRRAVEEGKEDFLRVLGGAARLRRNPLT